MVNIMDTKVKHIKESVAILPYFKNKVLLQLRDNKDNIIYPNRWGFFSGSIEKGERPLQCAKRELYEELSIKPSILLFLRKDFFSMPYYTTIYSYFFCLEPFINNIKLNEGSGFGLFTLNEMKRKTLYSNKTDKYYSLIDIPYIISLAKYLFNNIEKNKFQ